MLHAKPLNGYDDTFRSLEASLCRYIVASAFFVCSLFDIPFCPKSKVTTVGGIGVSS